MSQAEIVDRWSMSTASEAEMNTTLKSVVLKEAKIGSISLSAPLGIGTMFWGDSYVDSLFGPIVNKEDIRAVTQLALESKVTLFDSAEGYGGGTSEVRLGQCLRECSHASTAGDSASKDGAPVVMTKFLPTTWRWTERSFLRALTHCQARLYGDGPAAIGKGLPPIDIFYIHTPVHPLFEFWVACACKARAKGLIREIGLSNCGYNEVERAVAIAQRHGQRIAANQVLFSLLSYNSPSLRRMEQLCRQHDITIVAYAVLGQGLLTDNLTREKFAGNRAAKMTRVKYEELQGLRQEISILAAKYKVTMAQVCLNWAIQKQTIPLVGVKNTKQLGDALGCLEFNLAADEVERLDAAALSRATLEKSRLRRGLFVVLLSILVFTYRVTSWVPRSWYMKKGQKKAAVAAGGKTD